MDEISRDIKSGRLSKSEYIENFTDIHPPLNDHEAIVEGDRCYFCYDAPCVEACPTGIDIPLFIRQISAGNSEGAAKTIFDQNILGGMTARVCPTETLCQEACVRNTGEDKPVKIGLLQRYATDKIINKNVQTFSRSNQIDKKIAVVGGGPSGLSCAHRLATKGYQVTIFEANSKIGGLNEYGIASYKTVNDFAQKEAEYIMGIGGIEKKLNVKLGDDIFLSNLKDEYDAVFLALGLTGVNSLGIEGEELVGIEDAVNYIEDLRQVDDLSKLKVGRKVVVIGGGFTAIDIAIQSKKLGAEEVTIVYRRGKDQMSASELEQMNAQNNGVNIKYWLKPSNLKIEKGQVTGIEFDYTTIENGKVVSTGEKTKINADIIFRAIGQKFNSDNIQDLPNIKNGRIIVDKTMKTSIEKIWAGGDCTPYGEDLTVTAVEQGKIAAEAIHEKLSNS